MSTLSQPGHLWGTRETSAASLLDTWGEENGPTPVWELEERHKGRFHWLRKKRRESVRWPFLRGCGLRIGSTLAHIVQVSNIRVLPISLELIWKKVFNESIFNTIIFTNIIFNNIIPISYYSCRRQNILWTLLTFWPPLCTSLLHVLSFMSRTSVQRISAVFAAFAFYELESMFPGTRQHKCGGGGVLFCFFSYKKQ